MLKGFRPFIKLQKNQGVQVAMHCCGKATGAGTQLPQEKVPFFHLFLVGPTSSLTGVHHAMQHASSKLCQTP